MQIPLDLLMIVSNNGGEFERRSKEIYPLELELKKENGINTEGSFLDLGIKIRDIRFSICPNDK